MLQLNFNIFRIKQFFKNMLFNDGNLRAGNISEKKIINNYLSIIFS